MALVFFALLSSAVGAWPGACPLGGNERRHLDAARTEGMPDLAVALQLSSQKIHESTAGQSEPTPNSLTQGGFKPGDLPHNAGQSPSVHDVCQDFLLRDKAKNAIALSPRASPAKLIDTFAFVDSYEVEELLLRFYEMGEEVSEIHIVEGDRDFTGGMKPYNFDALLNSGQLDPWKNKITYHQVKIPEGVKGYAIQGFQRRELRSQMNWLKDYDQSDMLLESDFQRNQLAGLRGKQGYRPFLWHNPFPLWLNVPQILKTRVHLPVWKISGWPIWLLIDLL